MKDTKCIQRHGNRGRGRYPSSQEANVQLLSEELVSLARVQLIISPIIILLAMVLLPKFGFGGLTLR